ncbi:mesencephalic astrocyte-derived neurotrophic factor homolog [Lytechinus pictus]|uniref:mesencephalic astrocyte-derived neurotrophic factor homolog n=1 Tax=Lytechinus variegatus TaxID=7654 RepID=UPI001BB27D20|nr:mesencephalic astrocyte-derived neurotrophic factor homolog [Lytechinus variegatus]XP_041457732.1 mesencephalic astrocyte-derived neurotrophic factor homolog [Lytechinus variegatus]XP_054750804.1 mesencephalic astrocyte-derived neurotrophic factor homolog [Lytechinus pictus]XP_054750807.1 mesencephalic astrocyte-derived neurotrophic factor homolog [Lytechinus pictus]
MKASSQPMCSAIVFLSVMLMQFFAEAKIKEGECDVCISVVKHLESIMTNEDRKSEDKIEKKIRKYCKDAKGKENRFCYYMGGTADAATGMLNDLIKPLSVPLPPERICEKLNKKDSQICELKYEKQIDFDSVDLKKLRVKELKKILSDWEEDCKSCIEKSDFVKRIEELKPKYVKQKPREDL